MPKPPGNACAGLAADTAGAARRASTAGRPTATVMALRRRAAAAAPATPDGPLPATRIWRITSSATRKAPRPLSAVRPPRVLGPSLLAQQGCCSCHLAGCAVKHCCLPETALWPACANPAVRRGAISCSLIASPLHCKGAHALHESATLMLSMLRLKSMHSRACAVP